MKIAVSANNSQWNLLTACAENVEWVRSDSTAVDADAFFILEENAAATISTLKPVFINSVINTLQETNAAPNVIRFNGWNSFIMNNCWELSGTVNYDAGAILSALNKTYKMVQDQPGFVAARIISMIINEAYFALGESVSSKSEIDIAMKLGTNYPFGPFEWATMIGIKNVYLLLKTLSVNDSRYQPSPLLEKEVTA